jgi:hypothetical protein
MVTEKFLGLPALILAHFGRKASPEFLGTPGQSHTPVGLQNWEIVPAPKRRKARKRAVEGRVRSQVIEEGSVRLTLSQGFHHLASQGLTVLWTGISYQPSVDESQHAGLRPEEAGVTDLKIHPAVFKSPDEHRSRSLIAAKHNDVGTENLWPQAYYGSVEVYIGVRVSLPRHPERSDFLDLCKRPDNL